MSYQEKYLKYKNKYIYLKEIQKGGLECNNKLVYKNILGTCWMIAIQMIFSFGDVTSNYLQCIMKNFKINDEKEMEELIDQINYFIENQIQKVQNDCKLKNVLPAYIFNKDNIIYLKNILDKFITRYYSKVLKIKNYYFNPHYDIDYDEDNPNRCELVIEQNYYNLFNKYKRLGSIIDLYLFANILSIFFLDYKISFTNYYQNNFNNITYNDQINIGIIILIKGHVCCFFICNDVEKYYNDADKQIFDCEWKKILKESSNENCLYVKKKGCIELLNKEQYICYKNKSELSIVESLIVVSKNIQNSIIDNQIQNILNETNLDKIYDKILLHELGIIYDNGIVTSQDYKQAIKFFKLSADQGYPPAQNKLGVKYENSDGVKPNYSEAIKYFKLAAKQGNVSAQYKLGVIYDEGKYLSKNDNKAFKYFKLAANQGDSSAQYNLASMYQNGDGVKQDYKEAIKYYKLSADQGFPPAQNNLGSIYKNGDGVEQDYKEAIKYYKLAADQGYPPAQNNLGSIYENGDGVEQDYNEAIKYYKLSADQGYPPALNNLKRIYKN